MMPLSEWRKADLVRVARLAGVSNAGKRRRRELLEILCMLDLGALGTGQLRQMAACLGVKRSGKISRSALLKELFVLLNPGALPEPISVRPVLPIGRASTGPASGWGTGSASGTPAGSIGEEWIREQLAVTQVKFAPAIRHDLLLDTEPRLAEDYGETRVTLLVRDPYWLHVYWELTPDRIDWARSAGGGMPVLRVYELHDPVGRPDSRRQCFDIHRGEDARNWYVQVPADDRTYLVEVGYLGPQGEFLMLAKSNSARTPRAGVSPILDARFAAIPLNKNLAHSRKALAEGTFQRLPQDLHRRMMALSTGSPVLLDARRDEGKSSGPVPGSASGAGWTALATAKGRIEGATLAWYRQGSDVILAGNVTSGNAVRINGNEVIPDASGYFEFRLSCPADSSSDPVIAYSATQQGLVNLAVAFPSENEELRIKNEE